MSKSILIGLILMVCVAASAAVQDITIEAGVTTATIRWRASQVYEVQGKPEGGNVWHAVSATGKDGAYTAAISKLTKSTTYEVRWRDASGTVLAIEEFQTKERDLTQLEKIISAAYGSHRDGFIDELAGSIRGSATFTDTQKVALISLIEGAARKTSNPDDYAIAVVERVKTVSSSAEIGSAHNLTSQQIQALSAMITGVRSELKGRFYESIKSDYLRLRALGAFAKTETDFFDAIYK